MSNVKSLLLVWKSKQTGSYYHVGTLSYDGKVYTFEYSLHSNSTRNVKVALQNGYHLHPAFPNLEQVYKSQTLFEAFNRRIPDRSRIGFETFISEFNLDNNADRMDILQATRGALADDPYTFEQPLRLKGNILGAFFFINGMRHQDGLPADWEFYVSKGDILVAERQDDNLYDPYAVKLSTRNGIDLGYVPAIYSQAISALLARNVKVSFSVEKTRPEFASQWWVEIAFQAIVDVDDTKTLESSDLYEILRKEPA